MAGYLPALLVLAALSLPSLAAAQSAGEGIETARAERTLIPTHAAGAISLDGLLDEPAWAGAPVASDFIQNEPREGVPATFDTEVRVLYDDQAIYFGVFAKDDDPAGIVVNDLKKDFNTGNSDGFRIILDTFPAADREDDLLDGVLVLLRVRRVGLWPDHASPAEAGHY